MGTVAVTGAGSGIGAATVARLRASGNRVVTVDLGGDGIDIEADLGTAEGRQAAIAGILDRSGGALDGVVPCAGIGAIPGRAGSLLVSVNYFGTVAVLDGVRAALAAAGGAAVAVSSNSATCAPGTPDEVVDLCLAGDEAGARAAADAMDVLGVYPASKIAVARWVRRSAPSEAWIGAGVRLNAVAPGMTETAMVAESRADPTVGPLIGMFPVPRGEAGRADEIAAVIGFLLSSDASFVVGSVVFADGGTDALLRADAWPSGWEL